MYAKLQTENDFVVKILKWKIDLQWTPRRVTLQDSYDIIFSWNWRLFTFFIVGEHDSFQANQKGTETVSLNWNYTFNVFKWLCFVSVVVILTLVAFLSLTVFILFSVSVFDILDVRLSSWYFSLLQSSPLYIDSLNATS